MTVPPREKKVETADAVPGPREKELLRWLRKPTVTHLEDHGHLTQEPHGQETRKPNLELRLAACCVPTQQSSRTNVRGVPTNPGRTIFAEAAIDFRSRSPLTETGSQGSRGPRLIEPRGVQQPKRLSQVKPKIPFTFLRARPN